MHTHKTKKISLIILVLFMFVFAASELLAAKQTTCPVMNGSIIKELSADYKGERIYFCCAACPAEFAKDPEKYLKKMKEMGQEPEKIELDT